MFSEGRDHEGNNFKVPEVRQPSLIRKKNNFAGSRVVKAYRSWRPGNLLSRFARFNFEKTTSNGADANFLSLQSTGVSDEFVSKLKRKFPSAVTEVSNER